MALRSTVSRIARTPPAEAPTENPSALDNLKTEADAELETEPETGLVEEEISSDASGVSDEPHEPVVRRGGTTEPARLGAQQSSRRAAVDAPAETAPAKKRTGRPPGSGKKTLQSEPALTGTESVPELRAKIKDVETSIRETRTRHDAEMKALKDIYADLHARMFELVK